MAVRKPESRKVARELRAQGWAMRRIAHEVGVALSTVSLWVRDVAPAVPVESFPAESQTPPVPEVETVDASRRCGRCERELPASSFNRHPTGRQWWCRDCFREYFRGRGERHRIEVRVARQRRRREARAFIDEYLRTRRCCKCGEADPRVLEFHHLGDKHANVTDLMRAGFAVRALERELAHCTVLCVNCHRVATAAGQGSWRQDPASVDANPHLTSGERRNLAYVRALLLRTCCADCGESRLEVLEFDHLGVKTGCVVEMARRGCSLGRLQEEISHCEIRCSNCHRRRHAELREAG